MWNLPSWLGTDACNLLVGLHTLQCCTGSGVALTLATSICCCLAGYMYLHRTATQVLQVPLLQQPCAARSKQSVQMRFSLTCPFSAGARAYTVQWADSQAYSAEGLCLCDRLTYPWMRTTSSAPLKTMSRTISGRLQSSALNPCMPVQSASRAIVALSKARVYPSIVGACSSK